jgi:Flp pilus assembly protein TadG
MKMHTSLTSTGSRVLISTWRVRHHQNCLQNPGGWRLLLWSANSGAAALMFALCVSEVLLLLLLLRAAMALAQLCS